ncbi:ComF family protein [Antarcticirhabdus aurantiaca]|uniref:ComF family protein n=1 Tax=Antarcticirhabdus aurantiaca TaxID=2606717 RepID=UPI003BB7C0E2
MGLWGGVGEVASVLDRFLFPPLCAGCDRPLMGREAVCAGCWTSLAFVERPFCEVLGLPFGYDPGPGSLSADAIADPPPFARLRAAVLYGGLSAKLAARLKYGDRLDLAPLLAAWMARAGGELLAEAEVIVPVPLHRGRLWHRRFNQSAELARRLVRTPAPGFAPQALRRVRPTRAQVGLGPAQRRENVRGAFRVESGDWALVEGRRVLLVDDVYTTGATVRSASRALLKAGAASVDVLVFARVAPTGASIHIP